MVSSFHPITSLCSPVCKKWCSAWLSVHWWHQNLRRIICCVSLFKTVSSFKNVKQSYPECLCLFHHCSPGAVVWYSVFVTNTINLSPFTSGNSRSPADLTSPWFVVHVVDPRYLNLDRAMWKELSHLIKVILTNQNLRILIQFWLFQASVVGWVCSDY